MFTVMKNRDGLARDDYRDPGPYQFPKGTVAYEVDTPAVQPVREEQGAPKSPAKSGGNKAMKGMKIVTQINEWD